MPLSRKDAVEFVNLTKDISAMSLESLSTGDLDAAKRQINLLHWFSKKTLENTEKEISNV